MTRRRPLRRVPPLVVDVAIAAFFTVLAQVELRMDWDDGYHAGPLWLNSALQLLVTVPLLGRSAKPRLTFTLMCLAIAVPALVTARTVLFWGDMLPLMLVVFTVARARRDEWAWAAAPVATLAGVTVAIHNDEMPITDGFFALVMFGAAQLAGRLVGHLVQQRTQLSQALHQLAVEQKRREEEVAHDERRRIATEMHDVIAHAVSLMAIQVGAARLRLESSAQPVPDELRSAEETGRRALAELRRTLGVMRRTDSGGVLEPLPGVADLTALVDRFSEAGLDVGLQIDIEDELPDSVQLAVYRIVQESLTNVVRHAGRVRTDVRVLSANGEVVVNVRNAPGSTGSGGGAGHGVAGMRERVSMFGGTVAAEPTDDGGFSIAAHVPLAGRAPERHRTGVST